MPKQSGTVAVPDRRQRFREYMKRFNPTAPARLAIGEGLIVKDAGRSVYKKLAARADLAVGSQQLVVGGIGSGKTTQLLLAERELAENKGTLPLYIDVSTETDLTSLSSGALLASLGMRMWGTIKGRQRTTAKLSKAYDQIKAAAYGYEKDVWIEDFEPNYDDDPDPTDDEPDERTNEPGYWAKVRMPGKLTLPLPAIRRDVVELAHSVSELYDSVKEDGEEIVAVLDGLDRLIHVDRFWSVAEQDLRAMKPLEISVLTAGPLSIMYGQGRQMKDYFDEVHYLPPAIADPKESPFLLEILHLRGAEELMDRDQMRRICLASGGVLRDLISVARSAAENAYLDDADHIGTSHVDRAIEQLGNGYLLGLGTRQRAILNKILDGGGFTPSDSESMELLITRRVLEQSESRYEVHPALAAVLPRS